MPLLTIAFPTWLRAADAEATVKQLRETVKVPYELIVVDNSPTPLDLPLIPGFERLIRSGANLGTAARNLAIAEARGEYLLMLDDDSCPESGAVEYALDRLSAQPAKVIGLNPAVLLADGKREGPPLLPTVFHGCGVLFRTAPVKCLLPLYPTDFLYYGEEYWSTLKLYSAGYRLAYDDAFRVIHRKSETNRDQHHILRQLTVNNRRTWSPFIPDRYLEAVTYDTTRRYELIATKEGVPDAFSSGIVASLPEYPRNPMSETDFEDFSLLSALDAVSVRLPSDGTVILLGAGKFPSLWADRIATHHPNCTILVTDFNSGLWGHSYGRWTILDPVQAATQTPHATLISGLASRSDNLRWQAWLKDLPHHSFNLVTLDY